MADQDCCHAVDIFLSALGSEAANLAMRYQAHGGVFIAGGGIASKMLHRILDGTVLRAYLDKGHSTSTFAEVPLFVVNEPGDRLAFRGAFACAISALRLARRSEGAGGRGDECAQATKLVAPAMEMASVRKSSGSHESRPARAGNGSSVFAQDMETRALHGQKFLIHDRGLKQPGEAAARVKALGSRIERLAAAKGPPFVPHHFNVPTRHIYWVST